MNIFIRGGAGEGRFESSGHFYTCFNFPAIHRCVDVESGHRAMELD